MDIKQKMQKLNFRNGTTRGDYDEVHEMNA